MECIFCIENFFDWVLLFNGTFIDGSGCRELFSKGRVSEDTISYVFEPILYCYICTITTEFYISNTLYCEGHMGNFCHLVIFFLRKDWRNTAYSLLLFFLLSIVSCCCHCCYFQQQQLQQAV